MRCGADVFVGRELYLLRIEVVHFFYAIDLEAICFYILASMSLFFLTPWFALVYPSSDLNWSFSHPE